MCRGAGQLQFFGNDDYPRLFDERWRSWSGWAASAVLIDFAPFLEAAQLLYQGPWVAERYVAAEPTIATHPEALLPVTRQIIERGAALSAVDAFRAQYRLRSCVGSPSRLGSSIDVLLTPTAGTDLPYR